MKPTDVIVFIVAIFAVNVVYFGLNPAFVLIQAYTVSTVSNAAGLAAVTNIRRMFDYMIPIFSVVAIIWLFLRTQTREPDEYPTY